MGQSESLTQSIRPLPLPLPLPSAKSAVMWSILSWLDSGRRGEATKAVTASARARSGVFHFPLSRGALWLEQSRVRGTRGVRCLVAAAARGSCLFITPFALCWINPRAFLTRCRRGGCHVWEAGHGDRGRVRRHVVEELLVVQKFLVHDFRLDRVFLCNPLRRIHRPSPWLPLRRGLSWQQRSFRKRRLGVPRI